uniref:Cytochrome c oxidase subunit 3 n=1 Tax=Rhinogobio typus TaxID=171529 RepID=A0A0F7NQS0_9TELE|nr:cytochrome c oxidase subunit III [Rhinogobio typus]
MHIMWLILAHDHEPEPSVLYEEHPALQSGSTSTQQHLYLLVLSFYSLQYTNDDVMLFGKEPSKAITHPPVQKGLRYGMILFITSEVFFFLGFFWAFYHSSLAPTPELGGCWPPTGITTLDPFEVPLLNTAVLLASGVTVTWAHHSIMEGERKQAIQSLTLTILLGFYFTALQAMEYYEAPFTIADGVYGSTFFVATGFHGLHVIIGSTFLAVCLIRQIQYHFTSEHHFGFEAAAWYWHFVDVVWLFLYVSIYWWGS